MTDEIEYLLFNDFESGTVEDFEPGPGRTDLLATELVEKVVFKSSRGVFAEPGGILEAELTDDKVGPRETAAKSTEQFDDTIRFMKIFMECVTGGDAVDKGQIRRKIREIEHISLLGSKPGVELV